MEKGLKYKRIIILGGSGSGKSTLTGRIGEYTGYPMCHLDNMFYNSKWERVEKNEWENISNKFLLDNIGIVDGNYPTVLLNRIKWADLIIFIDTSMLLQLYRYFKRIIKVNLGMEKRYGVPDSAKTKVRFKILKWIINWNRIEKKKIFSMLKLVQGKKFLIIKEQSKLNIKSLFE